MNIVEQEYDFSKEIDIYISNLNRYKSLCLGSILIFGNNEIHLQMMIIRRLFLDWIYANKKGNISDLVKYSSFKRAFNKYIKKNNISSDFFFVLWSDFNKFLIRHGDYCLEIYNFCMYSRKNHKLSKVKRLLIYSIICVGLFFKWRKRRNDLIRKWVHYNTKRKKKFNYDFSDANIAIVLNEAKSSISLLSPNVKFN